ncbi:MAG TPA: hypothetical protein VF308_08845, partial [Caldimonas sp.]
MRSRFPKPAAGDAHAAARGRERAGIVEQIADHLAEPRVVAGHLVARQRTAFEGERHAHLVAAHLVGGLHQRVEQLGEIDRSGFLALQLGIETAGVGNIRNQPIEPLHIVLDDVEQALAVGIGLGHRQRFHRRAQRGERVAQFMRDVGGEALDRLDAGVERIGHVAQRARQMPDLVAPAGEIRNLDAGADAPSHPLGAVGQPAHRAGDGAGQQHREHHHDGGGDQEHLDDGEPLGLHHVVDVGALRGQHQRAAHRAEALHRHR